MDKSKKLYRDSKNGKIAGVCAGLSDYFDMDVSLVRILAVVSVFVSGLGLVFYVAAWFILPDKTD